MKVTVKSLAGGNFQLDAEPSETVSCRLFSLVASYIGSVAHLSATMSLKRLVRVEQIGQIKNKIKELQGHAVEQQKIIFSGKILTDDKTVADCNIKEKDFLVVMVSKVRYESHLFAREETRPSTSMLNPTVFASLGLQPKAPKPEAAAASTSAAPASSTPVPAAPETAAAPAPAPAPAAPASQAPESASIPTPAAPATAGTESAPGAGFGATSSFCQCSFSGRVGERSGRLATRFLSELSWFTFRAHYSDWLTARVRGPEHDGDGFREGSGAKGNAR